MGYKKESEKNINKQRITIDVNVLMIERNITLSNRIAYKPPLYLYYFNILKEKNQPNERNLSGMFSTFF